MSPGLALVATKPALLSAKDVLGSSPHDTDAPPRPVPSEATIADYWMQFARDAADAADESTAASAFTAFSAAHPPNVLGPPLCTVKTAAALPRFQPASPPPLPPSSTTASPPPLPPVSTTASPPPAPAKSTPLAPAKPTQRAPASDVVDPSHVSPAAASARGATVAGALAAVQRAHSAVKEAHADLEARRLEATAAIAAAGRHSPAHWLARGGLHDAQNTLLNASRALYHAMKALSEADGSAALVATACAHAAKLLKLRPDARSAPRDGSWADLRRGHSKAALCLESVMQRVARASNAHELLQLATLQRALAEVCGELERLSAVAGGALAGVASCSRLAKASAAARAAPDGDPTQWREAAFYFKAFAEYLAAMMPPVNHARLFSLCQASNRLQLMAQRAAVRSEAGAPRSIVKSKLRFGSVFLCGLCAPGTHAASCPDEDWGFWEAASEAAQHMKSFHGLPEELAESYVRCEQVYVPYTALCCGICAGPFGPLGLKWSHWKYARAHLPQHQHTCHRVDVGMSASLVREEVDYVFEQTASQLCGGVDGIESCERWLESEVA